MKLRMRIMTGILFLMVAVFSVACSSEPSSSEPSYQQLKEDNEKLKAQIKEQNHLDKTGEGNENLAKKVKELQAENKKLTKKVKKLESSKASSNGDSKSNWKTGKKLSAEEVLELLWWKADKPYEMRDPEFNFYSDPSCKKKFIIRKDLTFINSFDYEIVDPDTKEKAYISMTCKREAVFSRKRPYFNQME